MPALCTVAKTVSGASLTPTIVTVAVAPGAGLYGFTVAEIVPVGERKVISWVIAGTELSALGAIQMQNMYVPGWYQVSTSERLKLPLTLSSQKSLSGSQSS